tara:strand:+ start:476 stop:2230 length:1755 start_codon:yes stop_codon:yes gene_type:complete
MGFATALSQNSDFTDEDRQILSQKINEDPSVGQNLLGLGSQEEQFNAARDIIDPGGAQFRNFLRGNVEAGTNVKTEDGRSLQTLEDTTTQQLKDHVTGTPNAGEVKTKVNEDDTTETTVKVTQPPTQPPGATDDGGGGQASTNPANNVPTDDATGVDDSTGVNLGDPPADTGDPPVDTGDPPAEPPLPVSDPSQGIIPQEDRSLRGLSNQAFEEGGFEGFLSFAENRIASHPLFERKVQSGFEDLIANRVTDLEYDRAAVVSEGEAEIEQNFNDAALELARFANLEPGGTDSGAVIDKMERLLSARETARVQLKQRAREMEFEAADKAIARMTETANTFFGQDVTRAGLTGEFRGETTVQEDQRKFENEQEVTRMYGGKPPTITTIDEFRNSMNSSEGDASYREEFDIDNDGTIGFTDWLHVSQGATMMPDGRIAFGEGPRTIQGQEIDQRASQFAETHGLDVEKFQEANRQWGEQMSRDLDKFISGTVGKIMHTDENGNLQLTVDPATGLPLTSLDKAALDTDIDQFNRSFEEGIRQFAINAGFKERELGQGDRELDILRNKNFANVFGTGMQGFFQWLNRPR